ncbi:MAG: aminotransferase [Pseudomonadota bacterium]
MTSNEDLGLWDRENLFHPSTHLAQHARGDIPGRIITGGKGVYIYDNEGRTLLDGFGGLYCVNVGYGRTEIADAIAAQANKLAYYHAYTGHGTEASITLAKMVIDRAPEGMSRVYFGLSGSDANETNIKLVWYYNNTLGRPEKKKIISRWRAYHGSGLISGSLSGLDLFHKAFDLPLPQFLHTQAPYYFRRPDPDMSEADFVAFCAAELEALIDREGPETIAAFVGEPALGTGGLVPPPEGYWDAIQSVLAKYDILLIVDEVVSGFGRLGTMFGCERYSIRPDLISIAKGLTSAYAPLSGAIVSEQVWKVLEEGTDKLGPFGHGWTYSAHPVSAAAGIANLNLVDRLNLARNAEETGAHLKAALQDAIGDHRHVGDIRGDGLLCAVEFVADRESRRFFPAEAGVGQKIAQAMLSESVIARPMPQGDIIGFAPPLCLRTAEADTIVAALRKAVKTVFD